MLGVGIFRGKGLMISFSGFSAWVSSRSVLVDNRGFNWVQNLTCVSSLKYSMVRSLLYLDSIHHYLKKARHFKVNYWGLYWIAYQLQFFFAPSWSRQQPSNLFLYLKHCISSDFSNHKFNDFALKAFDRLSVFFILNQTMSY